MELQEFHIWILLSLQGNPLGCSSRMPGNLKFFMVFLTGSSQVTYRTSHSQDMHETRSRIRLLTTIVQRFDNMVKVWRTYYASRFIHKTVIYKWLIITRKVLAIQIINMQIGWQLSHQITWINLNNTFKHKHRISKKGKLNMW